MRSMRRRRRRKQEVVVVEGKGGKGGHIGARGLVPFRDSIHRHNLFIPRRGLPFLRYKTIVFHIQIN